MTIKKSNVINNTVDLNLKESLKDGVSESPDKQLPFTLQDLRAAIPPECFQPSLTKSLYFCFLDIAIVTALYAIAYQLNSWLFFPIFWLAQGTMFWALFVIGHDCGHGSFSKYKWLNNLIGHLTHTFILVPFHGWRISHRTHHLNTGSLENDESWYPVTETKYSEMAWIEKFARFDISLIAYPLYLFKRSPGKAGSHWLPNSPLFKPSEKWDVITSTACCLGMVSLLGLLTYQFGLLWFVQYYLMPYIIFVIWLDLVTFLHHTDPEIPWYSGNNWQFLKGALSTIDHDYGLINDIHHNIGTHVAHHIFLNMPHYHLKTATEAIKPILGSYYRKSERSIFDAFWRSYQNCHHVPDNTPTVYYQKANR